MPGIDEATAAFQTDMGGGSARSSDEPAPTLERFGARDIENDEIAGGDDLPNEGEVPIDDEPQPQRRQRGPDPDDGGDPDQDDEGLSEEERKAAGDDPDKDDPELDQKFAVTIDGEEAEVSLREALNGYIRNETFGRRMQVLRDVKANLDTELGEVAQGRALVIQAMEEVEALFASMRPPEPDWEAEFARDGQAAARLRKQYSDLDAHIVSVRAKRAKAVEDDQKARNENLGRYIEQETRKFAAHCKWQNDEEYQKDIASMQRTAASVGFTEQEIRSVYDSRMLAILRKASKYDRMMAARPRPIQNGPNKGGKSNGAGRNGNAPTRASKPAQQLRRTGRIDDAIPVFEQILNPPRRR